MKKLISLPLLPLLTLLAVDALGQQSNPLRITCPPNLTNWVCGGTSTAPVTYPAPTTTGSCPTNAVVTCSPPSGAMFILGTTTVNCTATNSCRESVSCSFTVTVARDTTPPIIQCPTNRTVWICGTASTTPVTFPLPTATDNADANVAVSCSPASGSPFPLGTTTVTCTATDNCTNRTTCTFTVTVARDTQPPTINCPPNTNVTACAATGAVVIYPTPIATDNADFNVAVTCSPASGSLFPPGNTTVTCTATDDCNLRTTCTFLVRVTRDTTPPVLQCPTNRVVWTCSPTGAVVNFNAPTATDNFDATPTVVCSPPSGSVFPLGATVVTCVATDDCNNGSTCLFTITVLADIVPPAIQCPTNVSVFTANAAGRLVYYAPLVMTDDSEANVSCVPSSGSLFPVGITPVVCTARDACGHERSCTFTVEVTLLTLRVSPGASGPLLSWTGGAMLEAADEVTGPWLPVRDARSPYLIQFLGAKKFFRLTAPVGDADCGQVVFSPSVWNIDVPSVRIQGRFLLNSRPFPSSFLQGANFFLRRVSTGDEVYLGLSNNETFDRRVVPGHYDVIYEHKIGDEVPLNSVAVLIAGLEISGDQVFDIDVPMVGVSGAFTLQGAAFPNSVNESGVIQARDSQNGALTVLGKTTDQTYAARLIPGTYDLMFSHISGNTVPANELTAFRRDVPIVVSGSLNMDVPTISVTGNFTVNGVLAPGSVNESGWIYLVDPDTGAKLLLGATDAQHYQRVLIPGAYDLLYKRISGGSVMPANSSARFLTGVQFVADGINDINLPVVEISGNFLVNGVPAPDNSLDFADIRLRHGEDDVYVGRTRVGHFSVLVIPGTYNVNFESLSSGDIMPANTNAVLDSVVIAGATVFDINIPAVDFAADVRFNGGNFPGPVAGESARLFLEDTLTGDLIPLAFNYPTIEHVARRVVRRTYRVRYEYESGTVLPRNTFATLGSSLTVTQNVQTVIDVRAVALSGDFRLNGGAFPGAQFAGVTARSLLPGDSLYLGGTQNGAYSTVVVPGHYNAFYNWTVGDLIPRNQNARLICPR